MNRYIGRFAPSPSGPLHAGSLVAALASFLDARAHHGTWLLRIEDIDAPRTVPGAAQRIERQLRSLGLAWDGPVTVQSQRNAAYRSAFERLLARRHLYPCACSRREIADSITATAPPATRSGNGGPVGEPVYPGTCREGIATGRAPRSWRFRVDQGHADRDGTHDVEFDDRWFGPQRQRPVDDTGDFVVARVDGSWTYQLAVVVDDGDAGVTAVVRGRDLIGSTGRQLLLQRALGLPAPTYLHVPLVAGADGEKLSKQNGAQPIDDSGTADPCETLDQAIRVLGIEAPPARDRSRWLLDATDRWAERLQKFGAGH